MDENGQALSRFSVGMICAGLLALAGLAVFTYLSDFTSETRKKDREYRQQQNSSIGMIVPYNEPKDELNLYT